MGSKFPRTLKIGSLNVSQCGAAEKVEEIRRMFVIRKLDVLVLSETNLRGKGEIVLGGVNERYRGRAKKGYVCW